MLILAPKTGFARVANVFFGGPYHGIEFLPPTARLGRCCSALEAPCLHHLVEQFDDLVRFRSSPPLIGHLGAEGATCVAGKFARAL